MTEILLRNRIKNKSLAEIVEVLFSPESFSHSLSGSFEISDFQAPEVIEDKSIISLVMKRFNFICPAEFQVTDLQKSSMTYVQTKGILKRWEHKMVLVEKETAIELQDHITYEMPFGLFGHLTNDLYFRSEVNEMFYKRLKTLGLK